MNMYLTKYAFLCITLLLAQLIKAQDISINKNTDNNNATVNNNNNNDLIDNNDLVYHDNDNSRIVFTVLWIMIFATQSILVYWQRYHKKSFNIVALVLLWLIPIIWSIIGQFYVMIVIWSLFSIVALYILFSARQRPLQPSTPRMTYSFFFFTFVICYYIAALGYILCMIDILGITFLILPEPLMLPLSLYGILLCWYGLYFGLLTRDCAEVSSTLLTIGLGYGGKNLLPTKQLSSNTCAICDKSLPNNIDSAESTIKLTCGHSYHEFCLRGITLVAKQDTCAICNEKVDTKNVFDSNVFTKQLRLWSTALDITRFCVVLIPTFTVSAKYIIQYFFGSDL